MDEKKEPGIRLVGVVVEHIQFDDMKAGEQKPKDLKIGLHIERRIGPESSEAVLNWRLQSADPATATFFLEVTIAGRFEVDSPNPNMPLDVFLRVNGPALVVPFAREIIANITARSRHGIVFLPAINVVEAVQQAEAAAVPTQK
jgi:preprotein translocase subunit SecB